MDEQANTDLLLTILVSLMGIAVAMLVCLIPWAYYIGSKLATIAGELKEGRHRMQNHDHKFTDQHLTLECHGELINDHETRITVLEKYPTSGRQQQQPR